MKEALETTGAEKKVQRQRASISRMALIVIGFGIALVAILADWIGLDSSRSFGRGETLLLCCGFVVMALGILGRWAVSFYRSTAIILLNTLVLFTCLEIVAIVLSTLNRKVYRPTGMNEAFDRLLKPPDQQWKQQYWQEQAVVVKQAYQPYTVWRNLPFKGSLINISKNGTRQTPGARCGGGSYKLFAFGGSVMWGVGVPDSRTIPAYLVAGLEKKTSRPVCIVNFGEIAYVSTQSLVELLKQLQSGRVPDMAIFCEGINDVFAAYQTGRPGVHQQLQEIAARFDENEAPFVKWLKASEVFHLLERWRNKVNSGDTFRNPSFEAAPDSLAKSVAETYLNNYKLVSALAKEYGFEYFFFVQPYISTGNKKLTSEEKEIRSGIDSKLADLFDEVYKRIELQVPHYDRLFSTTHVFDDLKWQVWIDPWGHLTPEGNQLIAARILDVIQSRLPGK